MTNSDSDPTRDHQRSPYLRPSDIGLAQLHSAAYQSLDVGVWKYDLVRRLASWEPEVEIILGTRPSSSPEDTFFGLMQPEDRPQMMAEFQKCLTERKPMRADFRIPRIDGSVGWMALTMYLTSMQMVVRRTSSEPSATSPNRSCANFGCAAQNEILRTIAVGVPAHGVFYCDLEHASRRSERSHGCSADTRQWWAIERG